MGKNRIATICLWIGLALVVMPILVFTPESTHAAGICGTGSWTSGNLEIHHINIGQGDSALIVGPTGKSLLLDAGESNWNSSAKAQIIGPYIEGVLGCKTLNHVLISHFHLDHIGYVGYGGLWHLVETQGFTVGTTLVRDYNNYLGDTSGTFTNWKTYLEGGGQSKLHPTTAIEGTSQVDLGTGVTFNIMALDGNGAIIAGNFSGDSNPPSENDYSIGALLSYGNFDEWLGGDLDGQYEVNSFGYTYHDIELSVAPEVGDVDVYKANHHGSSHSSSATFVHQLDPEVSILSVGDGNTFGHPSQEIMDRLLATSTVYMTQRGDTSTNIGSAIVAGNIVIKTSNGSTYTVNGTPYTATEPIRTDMDGDGYFAEADPSDNNSSVVPSPNGGCGPNYQICSVANTCEVSSGQVLINEFLPSPSPSTDPEWVELYNTTNSTINIGYCIIDDIVGGSPAYQIPASTLIPPHGFWTLDRITYFNNTGDDVRFLKEDGNTVLDTFTYGNTGSNLSWYRFPDGGNWAGSPTASTTKGQTNTLPFYPIVSSIVLADENPTDASTVNFTVMFSKAVTGVNSSDFTLTVTSLTSAPFVSAVNGSGATYTVTVNTGSGNGTIRLNVVDDDSIKDGSNHPLGGAGVGNGNFSNGETYTISRPSTIDVYIGSELKGNYSLPKNESTRLSYTDVNNGPLLVQSSNGVPIIASERVAYSPDGGTTWTSHSELMGLPINQLHTSYTFPFYNNVDLNSQLRFGNVGTATTTVTVIVAGQPKGSYVLAPNASRRVSYAGLNAGPVVIRSNGQPIIASLRVAYTPDAGATWTSFSEMMGLPSNKLTNSYTFPWYNNLTLNSQLRFGNVGIVPTTVTVTIAGQVKGNYTLQPSESKRVSYADLDKGPVKITSSGNVPIIASMRVAYSPDGGITWTDFSELMGLPTNALSTHYSFPVYDNVHYNSQLRFGNVGMSSTNITVTINGVVQGIYSVAPNASRRVSYPLDSGPVVIQSSGGVPIIASLRVAYTPDGGTTWTSFAEMMGLPQSQLTTSYLFPWYNNFDLDTELRFGVP